MCLASDQEQNYSAANVQKPPASSSSVPRLELAAARPAPVRKETKQKGTASEVMRPGLCPAGLKRMTHKAPRLPIVSI